MAPSGCRGGVSYVFSHDQSQEKFRPVSSQIGFFLQPAQRNAPGHTVPAGPSLPLALSLLIMTPKQETRGRVEDDWKPCGVCSHHLAHARVQTCFVGHVSRRGKCRHTTSEARVKWLLGNLSWGTTLDTLFSLCSSSGFPP